MAFQRLCFFVLIAALWSGCGEKKSPPAGPEKPLVSSPGRFKLDTASRANAVVPVDTAKEKEVKSNTVNPAPKNHTPSKPPGSPAYISKPDAVMYREPVETAAKIPHKFKVSENVYILETKMSDESGKVYDVPQWYKIQSADGQKGWVKSRFVALPF